MSNSESEDCDNIFDNKTIQTQNNMNNSYVHDQTANSKVIKYCLTSLKKYTHKPKRNSNTNEMLQTQTTKIDSISTFKREGVIPPVFQPIENLESHSNFFNSFCFTSEPRGGIVTFLNQHGTPYSVTFSEEQVEKIVFIQRQWRKVSPFDNTTNVVGYPGGIVYLPKNMSRFRSYSEDYNVCFDSKENMEPFKIKRLSPTYITKDSITNYEQHVEKFVGSQFKLRSAPKILKSKVNKMKSDVSGTWLEEVMPSQDITFTVDKKEKLLFIEKQKPLRIIGKNEMTYSIGCNTINWGDLNKFKKEVDLMIRKKEKTFNIASFRLDIQSSLLPWINKMSIDKSEDSVFQLISTKPKWMDICHVNSNMNIVEYPRPDKPVSICSQISTFDIKKLEGFHKDKLLYDYDKLCSIQIKGDNPIEKCNIYHDNSFQIYNNIRKWASKHEMTQQKQILISNQYDKPKNWNRLNKPFAYTLTLAKSKKSWLETTHKIKNDDIRFNPIYPKHIWNLLNKKKNLLTFTIDKTEKPKDMFFSISSQNYVDYAISVGNNEKEIIHTLTKRDIMYIWNKSNRIEYIGKKNEGPDETQLEAKKGKKIDNYRQYNQQYTFRADQMNSDEDDDEIDRIIAICRCERITIKGRNKVSLFAKSVLSMKSIPQPQYIGKTREIVDVKSNLNWNKTNEIDAEGIIDIFVPGDAGTLTESQISFKCQTQKEFEIEQQRPMDIMLSSNHKEFRLNEHKIQSSQYSINSEGPQPIELTQSNIIFSIDQTYPQVSHNNKTNKKILPHQSASFHYNPKYPSPLSPNEFTISNNNNFEVIDIPNKANTRINMFSVDLFSDLTQKEFSIYSFDLTLEGTTKIKDEFTKEKNGQSTGKILSIEEIIIIKWNQENMQLNTTFELIGYNAGQTSKAYSIQSDMIFSLVASKKNCHRTKWDSRILPVQAQFYKVLGQKIKKRNMNQITSQNIQLSLEGQDNTHESLRYHSLKNSLIISNEFFELLTPRSLNDEKSHKNLTEEIKPQNQSVSHYNNPNSSLNQQQPTLKGQKKILQKGKEFESDVVFSSTSKPSEIFNNQMYQLKSNGKKGMKISKKTNTSTEIINGSTTIKQQSATVNIQNKGIQKPIDKSNGSNE